MQICFFKRIVLILLVSIVAEFSVMNIFAAELEHATSITVRDGTGAVLLFKEKPYRIVSISPAATEVLFAAGCGDQVVARTSFCTEPPQAVGIPVLGGFDGKTFSIEAILALSPDLVYGAAGMHDFVREQLAPFGIPVLLSNPRTISEVIAEIKTAGLFDLDGTDESERCIQKIESELLSVQKQRDSCGIRMPLSVYWEVWPAGRITVGASSFIHAIITQAGGRNIFADSNQSYPQVSDESIIVRNPDVIIIPQSAISGSVDSFIREISRRPGWQNIAAVRNNKIIIVDDFLTTRCGPRIGKAVRCVFELLYPDVTGTNTVFE